MTSSSAGDAPRPIEPAGALPRWVLGVDVACVVLILLAAVVAEWGGFREDVVGVRVAFTSPYRLLVTGLALTALRHWLVPRPLMPAVVAALWRRGYQSVSVRSAFIGVAATRPVILLVGFLAFAAFGYVHERPPVRFSDDEVINLQGRWDTSWYYDLATRGYRFQGDVATDQQNIVFFPVFPAALHVVGRLFGGTVAAYMFGGTALTWVAFFLALVYVFRLARDLLGDDDRAHAAVLLVAAYPFAVYYGALYTESVYLLGVVATFFHARRRQWGATFAWGLMVGLTRPNGCFVSIPLVLVTMAPWLPRWVSGDTGQAGVAQDSAFDWKGAGAALVASAGPGIGVLLFCAFMWHLTGDPLVWAEGHAAWGREYVGFGPLAVKWYGYFRDSGVSGVLRNVPYDAMNALGALFVLALAVPVWRRFGPPYAVFILVNMLPPLAAGGFLSAGRFSAVMFPAFLWLAAVLPDRQRGAWVASFMAGQSLAAAMFYTWRELF